MDLQLIAERTTGSGEGYSPKTFRIWLASTKIRQFKIELGNLPSIRNSDDHELSCETFSEASSGKYLFAPLAPKIVLDFSGNCILRTNGICNCIGIAVWTPSGSYMLHCPPQELYISAEEETVMGSVFTELKTILGNIPLETKVRSKVYLASSMFTASFKLIKEQLVGLGYPISGIAVPDIIQERHERSLDYYIDSPLYGGECMAWQEANNKFVNFSTIMSMDTKDGAIFVKHLLNT